MKPLLESAGFTEEDEEIWLRICYSEPFEHLACAAIYAVSDRRDADLMLMLESGLKGRRKAHRWLASHLRRYGDGCWYALILDAEQVRDGSVSNITYFA